MNFYETVMGKRFFEGTMPSIARSLETLAALRKTEAAEGNDIISADTQEIGDDNGMIRIVAENSRHETRVVAVIDDLTSRVVYLENAAKTDSAVQSVIRKTLDELENMPVCVSMSHGIVSLNLSTPAGILSATAEPDGEDGDAMYICRTGLHGDVIDLASARTPRNGGIRIQVWSDAFSEDPVPQEPFLISEEDLQKLDADD